MINIALDSVFASKVGFVSHQNTVPILRELKVNNGGEIDLENLTLSLNVVTFFP
ncbi:hypothetical protein [Dickeya solani]|uniref:hypothetical protein n=1 Tax=Dickeya solani TaxID=1089444 RepID=UPI0003A4D847|nr:hypothetical protein [Dickeya solani]AUC41490.1 DNA helicase related protein [Dickeya solani RNS 08.23.3.1.A]MBJ2331965.1 hypothetical protein [Dickeya solani]MBJ2337901.1 hypothetical protein [Dickeya solani]MBJ2351904.1 hypothetical protein [Dickeya solani]MCZ0783305.1 hypothetical protein [Dickeya solani]